MWLYRSQSFYLCLKSTGASIAMSGWAGLVGLLLAVAVVQLQGAPVWAKCGSMAPVLDQASEFNRIYVGTVSCATEQLYVFNYTT